MYEPTVQHDLRTSFLHAQHLLRQSYFDNRQVFLVDFHTTGLAPHVLGRLQRCSGPSHRVKHHVTTVGLCENVVTRQFIREYRGVLVRYDAHHYYSSRELARTSTPSRDMMQWPPDFCGYVEQEQ